MDYTFLLEDRDCLNRFKEKKLDPPLCCLQETHLTCKDIQTESKGMEKKIFHAQGNQKTKNKQD